MKNTTKSKILAAVLATALLLSGCAGTDGQESTESTPATTQTTETVETTESSVAEVETETEPAETEETTQVDISGIVEVPEFGAVEFPESEALTFVENLQLGWNLGNTFDASNCGCSNELDYESAWCGYVTTRETIQTVVDAGFKTIRIPVSWHNHVDEDYNISEVWLNRVQEVVDWSIDAGLYVILNIHHDNEEDFLYPSYEKLDQSKEYVTRIWEQLADRFAEYDERLIFETMNEPRQTGTDHEWWIDVNSEIGKECVDVVNQLNQAIVDTIRGNGQGYNTSRYIMIPGYCASPNFALTSSYVIPSDDMATAENRLLVSVHAYTPYNFALAGPNEQYSTDYFSIAEKNGTGDIDSFMKQLYTKFTSQGIGVVIGEFGARVKNDNLQSRTEFAAYYVAQARHYGITVCWWDNNSLTGDGENFGLIRRRANEVFFPEIMNQMVYYSQVN